MTALSHHYPFDPSYGYDLERLLEVEPPPEPNGFYNFWRARYERAMEVDPRPEVTPSLLKHAGFTVSDLSYRSTDNFPIRGWVLRPEEKPVNRIFIMGHGYSGINAIDFALPFGDAAYVVPCFRGLCRSHRPPISTDPAFHVLHDIDKRDRYILGGCVEDLWLAVSVAITLFPQAAQRLAYLGISFGGGIGALAMPWDARIRRAHLNVPSFGHQPLRLELPSLGSAASLQRLQAQDGNVLETLKYYDAAIAVGYMDNPVHIAAALFDPMVAPPGQYAIYNALPGAKRLFVLDAGHFDYPRRAEQEQQLLNELRDFFLPL